MGNSEATFSGAQLELIEEEELHPDEVEMTTIDVLEKGKSEKSQEGTVVKRRRDAEENKAQLSALFDDI